MIPSSPILLAAIILIGYARGLEHQHSMSDIRRTASGELFAAAESAYDRMLRPAELLAFGSTGRGEHRRDPRC